MAEHKTGTREEWQEARDELAKLRPSKRSKTRRSRGSGWTSPGSRSRRSTSSTEDGKKTLVELFDGRSQLLAYNIMYGPDYEVGACPGCTSVGTDSTVRSST